MGKKVDTKAKEIQAKEAKAEAHEAKAEDKAKAEVYALDLLKAIHADWAMNGLDPEDIDYLGAKVEASEDGTEWASFTAHYHRADGHPVPGYFWGVSAPVNGGIVILRLVANRKVAATLKVWPSGYGILTGPEPVVKALLARPDLRPWTDEDLAALL
jgi:hypothetical protein